ncbi:HlyD family secretion protein [Pseudomonas protegens]|uniref:HlyD family secretion protein n=1 Tax=Pseudomonas protegens TaxID=380021 RepID=UPI00380DDCA2
MLIHQPLGYSVAALLVITFIAIVGAFSYFGTYTRKATVTGLLMPEQGILRLSSNGTGFISEVRVVEGQRVEYGDILFIISGERFSAAGGTQYLISEQLKQRVWLLGSNRSLADDRSAAQQRMLDSRLQAIKEELDRLHEEIRLLGRRVELSQAHLDRQQELVAEHFISIAQLQQTEAEMLALQGQHQALRRTQANLRREQIELRTQREEVDIRYRADVSDIDNSIALVKQEQAENDVRGEQIIVAPFQGVITGVSVQSGQQVMAGALLASLIPHDAKLTAHVYVPARHAGFIEPGQATLMRYVAYPYQKFGSARGRVLDIAKSPYAIQELPPHIASALQGISGTAELFYRATLGIESQSLLVYGIPQQLQVGMLLEADIIQEKRRLYEWALEPIYSVTGKWAY